MPVGARNSFPTTPAILWDVTGEWCPRCPPRVGADADGMGNPTRCPSLWQSTMGKSWD